jgi:hypothetical protein
LSDGQQVLVFNIKGIKRKRPSGNNTSSFHSLLFEKLHIRSCECGKQGVPLSDAHTQ